jgi:PAS domain S-box-containing protein
MNPLETYQLIFENTPHCVKVVSADGHLLNMNKAGLCIIGADNMEQVFRASVNDFVFEEDIQKFWNAHNRAMAGERVEIVFRVNTLKGEMKYMQSIMNPAGIYWENEKCVLSFTNDITQELASREELDFKAFLLNSVQQAVIATDLNGIVKYVNTFAEQLYGYKSDEIVGEHLRILMVDDPIIQQRGKELMDRLVQGETWQGEFVMKTKSGRIVSVHSSNAPIIQNGVLSGIIGISFDISERKRSKQERENLIAELTQRNQDLKQFGYIASHNMRAPVTNLTGLFSLLDKDKITDLESREIITGLERSTQNLNRVLTDLIQILNIREHTPVHADVPSVCCLILLHS